MIIKEGLFTKRQITELWVGIVQGDPGLAAVELTPPRIKERSQQNPQKGKVAKQLLGNKGQPAQGKQPQPEGEWIL